MGEVNKKDFRNGKIYSIRNWVDDEIYVGSTTQTLSKRMERHRGNLYSEKCWNYRLYQKMRDIGKQHFYIELIEKYECNDIDELRKREGEWIRKIGTLNHLVAGRTKQENYIENRDRILAQQKEYADNHKAEKKNMTKNTIRTTRRREANKQKKDMKKKRTISKKKPVKTITKRKKKLEQR